MAALVIAGVFFNTAGWTSNVRCDLWLNGLERAHGWASTGPAIADNDYHERAIFRPRDLIRVPDRVAATLLDRLLVSFLDYWHDDVFGDLKKPSP
jgi:hypothetical protein